MIIPHLANTDHGMYPWWDSNILGASSISYIRNTVVIPSIQTLRILRFQRPVCKICECLGTGSSKPADPTTVYIHTWSNYCHTSFKKHTILRSQYSFRWHWIWLHQAHCAPSILHKQWSLRSWNSFYDLEWSSTSLSIFLWSHQQLGISVSC